MKLKIKKAHILFIGIFLLLTILYFWVPIIVMPDSVEYYEYLNIFYGTAPVSSWNIVRGFGLPVILFVSTKIFGNNPFGLLLGTYVFYMLFNILYYLIISKIISKCKNNIVKIIISIIYFIFILFNPILFGYFHGLLTEFVAITLALYSCYVSYKFLYLKIDFKNKKIYAYFIFYILLFIFCWFLKQPYFTIALFPLLISIFISVFKYKSLKDFFGRISVLLISIIFLMISIVCWNNFLTNNGVDVKSGGNNTYFLKNAVINGISNFRLIEDNSFYNYDLMKDDAYIKNEDKERINNGEKYKIVNVYDNNGMLIDKMILYYKGKDFSTKDVFGLYIDALKLHPYLVVDSYYNGYLAMIDVNISQRSENDNYYYPIRKFDKGFNHENQTIGLSYLNNNNFLWLNDSNFKKVEKLHKNIIIPEKIKNLLIVISDICFITFKIVFLMLPFVSIIIVLYYLFKKRRNSYSEFAIILLLFAFLHALFHTVTGAIIDRYVYIVFPEIILGYLLLLPNNRYIMSESKKEGVLVKKKNKKSIFVIPAYNESKHIADVISDINKNMPESDIVVVNDYSKDNTKEIVEKMNIPCLNVPFNMGYAMAVQTGIKYAYENGYDYVIQFDADGQHLASEVKKLFTMMKKNNSNIVIGSRFLEKTNYKHPFFRKIGTKIFSIIIKIFCKKNITDPTSGFQLLDRSVIERYAMIGKYPEFPDANLIIEMLIDGYKIDEVSVKMKECDDGVSMHGGIIKPIKYMIKVSYTIVFILIRGFSIRRDK